MQPWPGGNTPEELEAEYNLRTRHPERQRVYDGYSVRSKAVRAELVTDLDVSYGSHERTLIDLFPVAGAPAILMFFHGGYWRGLDKSIFSFIAEPYVEAGYAVAMPNYPLAPETPITSIVDHARDAVRWVGQNRSRLGVESNTPIAVAGHSAGGHLAAMCATENWTRHGLESDLISACIPISGLFDLHPLRHTNVAEQVTMTEEEAHTLSPMYEPDPVMAPTLVVVGGDETDGFVWQSTAYVERLAHQGGHVQLCVEAGFDHFSILRPFSDPQHGLHQQVMQLLP